MSILVELQACRDSQIAKGFDADHDDTHTDGSLLSAATQLLQGMRFYDEEEWTAARVRRIRGKYTEREQLLIAAAFIVAEIERRDREG